MSSQASVSFGNVNTPSITGNPNFPNGLSIQGAALPAVSTSNPTITATGGTNVTTANIAIAQKPKFTLTGTEAVLSFTAVVTPTATNTFSNFTFNLPSRTTNLASDTDNINGLISGYSSTLSNTSMAPLQLATSGVVGSTTAIVTFTSNTTLDPHKISVTYRYLAV